MRRLIAALLFLFPAHFRRAFACDMLATFDDQWRDRAGWRLALRTVFDLIVSAARERCAPNPAPSKPKKGDSLMTVLSQDLRFALRTLLHSPGFTLVALATLALGIGVNTAMFSVANAVLWRSLPYPHPDRVLMVGEVDGKNPDIYWGTSYLNWKDWRARATSFEHLAGLLDDERILRESGDPVRLQGAAVSPDFFDVMGVAPALGRVFTASEDQNGAPPVIVLSHRMWTQRFARDPAILSRAIKFGATSFPVIGVMPPGFEYGQAEYWIPLEQGMNPYFASHRSVWTLLSIGRLRQGRTAAEAQKEVEAITAQIRHDYPETNRGQIVRADPLRAELSRDLRPALLMLVGASGFVLLIACGNLAGLMLVRGAGRSREMAIRSALGVGWRRLVRQLLTESALLAGAGGLTGIALAFWATRSIALLTKDPRLLHVNIDTSVLAFAALVTVLTTILFGIAPAIRATRVDAADALKSGGRTGAAPERAFSQRILVMAEVALCLVLLAGAGLLLKSFRRVFEIDPGFRAGNLATLRVSLPRTYTTPESIVHFYTQLTDRLSAVPGVSRVTIANHLPVTGGEANGDISIEDRPSRAGDLGTTTFRSVLPEYFDVMGIPLLRGRAFDARDDRTRGRVVIINDDFARRFWPHEDPIGKRIRVGPQDTSPWLTIVGVVGNVRQIGLDLDSPLSIYEPLAIQPWGRFEVAVRSTADPRAIIASVRAEMRSLDPALVIDNVETMSERIGDTVAPRRLNLVLFGLFAALALVLAAVGLYGVVAYAAAQRRQEFGVRMALGAQPSDVLRLVLGQGFKLVLTGIAIGTLAALALAKLMAGLLFGVEPTDPSTLIAVALLLSAVTVAACWLPAWRATRIAPVEALRCE
jgi:putative ABC transport system permease protein